MPVSCLVNRKKTKTRTQILCSQIDDVIGSCQKELNSHAALKEEIDYESGLLRQALKKNLFGDQEAVNKVLHEHKQWKNTIKSDVRADVLAEKRRLKQERKLTLSKSSVPTQRKAPQKRRRVPGRLI